MLKLIGACLIFLATSQIGFLMARFYADRPRQIRQLRSALSILETEIGYGTHLLVEACQQIAYRHNGIVSEIFSQFSRNLEMMDGASTHECFQKAIEVGWPQTAMKNEEKMILLDWSQTLGLSDREDQLRHLALVKTNLKVEEEKAREEQTQYEKMFKTLGVLSGAFLIILMY